MVQQITLDVNLPDDQTFDSYVCGENQQLLTHLLDVFTAKTPFLTYISGVKSSGKSHLLVALCNEAANKHLSHFYLALDAAHTYSPAILEGLEHSDLVCIDNLERIEDDALWQRALFDLINRIHENPGCRLVVTAKAGPGSMHFSLADLASRLTWGISFRLQPLDDNQTMEALSIKARHRGIELNADVARYLINHCARDMGSLTNLLDRLDALSLQEKRKLTIPFIKQSLNL